MKEAKEIKRSGDIKGEMKKIFALTVIVFAILCMFIYWFVQKIIATNTNEYMEVSEQGLKNSLNIMFEKLDNYVTLMSGDEELQELLTVPVSKKNKYIYYIDNQAAYFRMLETDIVDTAVVSDNMHYSLLYSDEDLDEICNQIEGNNFQWLGIRKSSFVSMQNQQLMFLYGKNIVQSGRKLGTIVLSVRASYFLGEREEMPFYHILTDERGTYFCTFSDSKQEELLKEWRNIGREIPLRRNKNYYIKATKLDKMGCFLLSVNDLNKKYSNYNMTFLQLMIWTCMGIIVLFVVVFFGFVNSKIVKPLQIFYDNIKEIRTKKQRYMGKKLELGGCAEIREIGSEFDGMIQDIDKLNKKIFENATHLYELELKKQNAELAYLRGQVDPHFLYNTLEVLRKQALEKQAPELAQMAVDMGNIFRYSAKGKDVVPLSVEVSIIKSYVRIQENRFQGRLRVFYMIPEELQNLLVIKMLIQPLVENAIYHGIEPKTGMGSIFIGVRRDAEKLIITIKDDGVGISKEKLEGIKKELSADYFDTRKHVGILNTQARIRLMYGTDSGLNIESNPVDGTSVMITVPAIEEEEDDVSGINSR